MASIIPECPLPSLHVHAKQISTVYSSCPFIYLCVSGKLWAGCLWWEGVYLGWPWWIWSCNWPYMGIWPTERPADRGDAPNAQPEQPWMCYYHTTPTAQIKLFFIFIWSKKSPKAIYVFFFWDEVILCCSTSSTIHKLLQDKCY